MKVLILPNDLFFSYLKIGEFKKKNFNPNNIINELYFITYTDQQLIKENFI